ncbi:enoyl-CoA hydratase/isomerase family protein [Parasphingorhabdus sp.]|uniref:enoyl-CoA hydratase/isomerase family protein n=1 Tax=Parasphingorhabdus sp. TaxID=2709688 RepID=UPI0032654481
MTEDIIIRKTGRVGHISLNRPKVIHSLNLDMCLAMTEALLAWRDDDDVEAVILDHSEGRGFCAGGDIAMLRESGMTDGKKGREFFYKEYQLNHLMFEYPKPVVAFMDGITMGGGVGISQPAQYRVATEYTRFAMPETGIGLFPDVGGGWYLSRLAGRLGQFLALTGARLDGAECMAVGIASHYLQSEVLAEAKQQIAKNPDHIETILAQLSGDVPDARITNNLDKIDKFFASDRYEDILEALAADDSDWAAKERKTLGTKSPQTCKVALRQLKEGAAMDSFADEMRNEYRIGYHVLVMHDFLEGVRALIVDKDNDPKWNPPTAEDVTTEWIDNIFAPPPADEEWKPL